MTKRTELLLAKDETIEDAVKYADPMALRGLMYQLTGDESLVTMRVEARPYGNSEMEMLVNESDIDLIRKKAADFLKDYRDHGAGDIPMGKPERLRTAISLTTGVDISEDEIGMWIEQLGIDPYARGLAWKKKPTPAQIENFKVCVIGAGMGGLNASVLLKNAGIPYFVIEKNDEVGGTWYENRYPGARVDSFSRTYTHVFGANYIHPYAFCPQAINLDYFQWVAKTYGVRDKIIFKTEVKSVIWQEATKLWEITAIGPEGKKVWHANAVITAVGFLSRPNMPTIEGMDTFKGKSFHTARWPEGLDLKGKRVAVIGTGATGYQTIPEIAKVAEHLHVFQRTPGWCFDIPGYLSPFPPQVNWLDRNVPYFLNFARVRASWMAAPQNGKKVLHIDPDFKDPHARSARNKVTRDRRIEFIKRMLASRPELVEKMIPPYPPMAARHILVDDTDNVYKALTRDNVTLVTDPIKNINEKGLVTANGAEIPVDIIVYATGFKAQDFLWPMEIRGRDGRRAEELWQKDGPRAYLGAMMPGFPNLFMIYGPNTNNFGGLQIVDFEELVVKFALECMGGLIAQNKHAVDVSVDAYNRYNVELDKCEKKMMYSDPRVNTYYRNESGRSAVNNPIDIRRIWGWTHDPSGKAPPNADHAIEPYFGQDLIVE
jgi:4-hydroxyacetophenone monooxygenase